MLLYVTEIQHWVIIHRLLHFDVDDNKIVGTGSFAGRGGSRSFVERLKSLKSSGYWLTYSIKTSKSFKIQWKKERA